MPRLSLAALALTFAPLPLLAQSLVIGQGVPVRAADMIRLDALDEATGAALRQVLNVGTGSEIAQATAALKGAALPLEKLDLDSLAGDWSCAMSKLGGTSAVVAYPAFRCRITADAGVIRFDKLSGSQRTSGQIHPDGDRLVYLGSTFVEGENPKAYGDFPAEVNLEGTETLPDVGIVEMTGPNAARILFPQPYRESLLNVMTLSR